MPETGPIHLLPFKPTEYQRKPGGGAAKPTLVPVTESLRQGLAEEVSVATSYGLAARTRNDLPVPVVARMRDKALAKSNRPYALLAELALPVEASLGSGELVVRGTVETLGGLVTVLREGHRQTDLFDISTFERFEVWEPNDVTLDPEWASAEGGVRLLTMSLFPWLRLDSNYKGSQTIEEFIASLGLEVLQSRISQSSQIVYLRSIDQSHPERLVEVQGIRRVGVTPSFEIPGGVTSQGFSPTGGNKSTIASPPAAEAVVVGVFDSGVKSSILASSIAGSVTYDTGIDLDPDHGTFVAGLVIAGRELNDGDSRFPDDTARVFNAQVLPANAVSEGVLIDRIEEVLRDHAGPDGPRVWNCSFAQKTELSPIVYSTFAQQMDQLASDFNVLFVQAAGNYEAAPYRNWPILPGMPYKDRLSSPAEAVRSMTVGAIAHKGGYVPSGSPASYSRRGPGFAFVQKPDVSHIGGDLSSGRTYARFGIDSIISNDVEAESVGTSFASPLISAIAANTWDQIAHGGSVAAVRPELVKGLLVHGAALRRNPGDEENRNYLGWGTPPNSTSLLNNISSEFTTVHEVTLTPGNDWMKTPFPVPACLISSGKFKGEVVLTISYDPPVNAAFGTEAIRHDVEGSFGRVTTSAKGHVNIDSIATHARASSDHQWESERVEGGKWTPLKTYRHRYPVGTAVGNWGLRLSLTERSPGEQRIEQIVYAIITFRSLDGTLPVYNDGVVALQALQHENHTMVPTDRLRVGQ